MGQKTHPTGFRIGITENWRSRWYSKKKEFGRLLVEDQRLRAFIRREYEYAGIPKIEIERDIENVKVFLHTARPGVIIGRKGARVDKLREDLQKICGRDVKLEIREIQNPEVNAQLVAESVGQQLLKRAAFRRVMKTAIKTARDKGAQGIRIQCSGRLGGAEMARCESSSEGKIPLQTLQANIDYGFAEAHTTYGAIGIKVWIYHGPYGDQEEMSHGAHAKKG
ncbi:MAG: 30S ribosomal protein S3 [Planctomycetes bacterium]|nr:30S ribosomal protein S3 [Planctomycetota bacterium]